MNNLRAASWLVALQILKRAIGNSFAFVPRRDLQMHFGEGRKDGGLCLYICLQSQGWFSRRGYTRRRNFGLCKERAGFSLRWEFQPGRQLASCRLCYRAKTHAAESLNPAAFAVCCLGLYSARRSPKQHTTLGL